MGQEKKDFWPFYSEILAEFHGLIEEANKYLLCGIELFRRPALLHSWSIVL